MFRLSVYLIFFSFVSLYSQTLQNQLESLKEKESNLKDQLSSVRTEIKSIENKITENRYAEESKNGIFLPLVSAATFFSEADLHSIRLFKKPAGTKVLVVGAKSRMWKVLVNDRICYTTYSNIDNKEMYDFYQNKQKIEDEEADKIRLAQEEKDKKEKAAAYRAKLEREKAAHENAMIEKYGEELGKIISTKKVRVGMTAAMAIDAWGKPKDINKTITATYIREQWVYGGGSNLYFKDGILETIQN